MPLGPFGPLAIRIRIAWCRWDWESISPTSRLAKIVALAVDEAWRTFGYRWLNPDARVAAAMSVRFEDADVAANTIREIVGNPFRPSILKEKQGCRVLTSGRGDKPHHCQTHHKDVVYVGTDRRTRYAVCPDSLEYFRGTYCTSTVLSRSGRL